MTMRVSFGSSLRYFPIEIKKAFILSQNPIFSRHIELQLQLQGDEALRREVLATHSSTTLQPHPSCVPPPLVISQTVCIGLHADVTTNFHFRRPRGRVLEQDEDGDLILERRGSTTDEVILIGENRFDWPFPRTICAQ